MKRVQHYIGGQWRDSVEGRTFADVNPATGLRIAEVARGSAEDVDLAVRAARTAFEQEWRGTTAAERAAMLRRIGDLIDQASEELAHLEAMDTGKPLQLARTLDIPRAAANFRFFANVVEGLSTEAFEMDGVGINYALRRPLGVAGLISPWNFPLLLLTWKVAPALAAGNTVVAKPAELTPLTAAQLAQICENAGVPAGVFNIVHGFGPGEAGEALTRHPLVDLLSLTGESATGRAVMTQGAETLKRVGFELGGKNPLIIFSDADWEAALETTVRSSFTNQGEVCLAPSRIYIERPIYSDFVRDFVTKTKRLRVGDPMDEATNVGAVISAEHLGKVERYLTLARQDGGQILYGGTRLDLPGALQQGFFLTPTIVEGLSDASRVVQEEVFGPVVTVHPFDSEDEVVRRANDTPYGLSATIWTQDLNRAHRVAAKLEAGIIWVNSWFLRDLRTPFGGMKQSGIGREGGVHSFEFYSELKNVCIKLA